MVVTPFNEARMRRFISDRDFFRKRRVRLRNAKNRNAMLFVQGEGRGHLTQAIAVFHMLKRLNYEIPKVAVGIPRNRQVPQYAKDLFGDALVTYHTLEIIYKHGRKVDKLGTIFRNVIRAPGYIRSRRIIRKYVRQHRPAYILNFFEPLAALAVVDLSYPTHRISVSHQNLFMFSPEFPLEGHFIDAFVTRFLTQLANVRTDHMMVLSLYPIDAPSKRFTICPPLLREEIYKLQTTQDEDVLVYLLNQEYLNEIEKLAERHPQLQFVCFCDHKHADAIYRARTNLTICKLDGSRFIEHMRHSKYVVTTSGFETVAEAIYMGKRVVAIPVQNHYEQNCNGSDLQRSGLGFMRENYDFQLDTMAFPDNAQLTGPTRTWFDRKEEIFFRVFDNP